MLRVYLMDLPGKILKMCYLIETQDINLILTLNKVLNS